MSLELHGLWTLWAVYHIHNRAQARWQRRLNGNLIVKSLLVSHIIKIYLCSWTFIPKRLNKPQGSSRMPGVIGSHTSGVMLNHLAYALCVTLGSTLSMSVWNSSQCPKRQKCQLWGPRNCVAILSVLATFGDNVLLSTSARYAKTRITRCCTWIEGICCQLQLLSLPQQLLLNMPLHRLERQLTALLWTRAVALILHKYFLLLQ